MRLGLGVSILMAFAWLIPGLAAAQGADADFDTVWRIVRKRCAICHSAIPQEDGLNAGSQPPKGVKFDEPADLRKFAPMVMAVTVTAKLMPPDNVTHMTDEERQIIGKWIQAGARTP